MNKKISISELAEWQKEYDLNLPTTDRGLAVRAKQEQWEYEEVAGRGGPGGVKKVYTLPSYVVEELSQKGLLHLLDKPAGAAVASARALRVRPSPAVGVPSFMRPMVAEYDDWAAAQDTDAIVPVRYHVNVFGSAGNGYALDEPLATEAMWFRRSFFDYLGVPAAQCFCTRVKGDSMHPTLIDRGTVLWHMQNAYTSEGIYLFRQVNELRIKRLQCVNSYTFRIISDNSNKDIYPMELLDLRELADHEFEIYGRYLWDCAIHP